MLTVTRWTIPQEIAGTRLNIPTQSELVKDRAKRFQMERRLVAILDVDAVGYSRWMGVDEEAAFAALSERREIIDSTIVERCGRIFGSAGDSVVAEFPSSVEATRCAVEIQIELGKLNEDLPEDERMAFRIGVNFGDVIAENGDLLGDGVNVAARIEGLAPAGGVCISRQVAEQISGKLQAAFVRAGRHRLKNIDRPIEVWCWPPECAGVLRRSAASWRRAAALGVLAAAAALGAVYVVFNTGKDIPSLIGLGIAMKEAAKARLPVDEERQAAQGERGRPEADPAAADKGRRRTEEQKRLEELRKVTALQEKANNLAAEIAYWNSVKDSRNPTLLQSYLDRFPEGIYATLAGHLIEQARSRTGQNLKTAVVPREPTGGAVVQREDAVLTRKLQSALYDVGCRPGHIDGKWGWYSQKALEKFAKHAKLDMPGDAVSYETLELIRRYKGRVCPPQCSVRHTLRNGRCVAKKCPKGRVKGASGACVVPPKRTQKARRAPIPRKAQNPPKPRKKARRRGVPFGGTGTQDCDFLADVGQAPC